MGFIFQQLSAKSNLILDLAIRNGNFFKARGKANNEKEVFLVLCLAQTPTIARWVVPGWSREGGCPFLKNTPGPPPGHRVRGRLPGRSRTSRLRGGWARGRRTAKEAAVCHCYFKQASLAGAVIL